MKKSHLFFLFCLISGIITNACALPKNIIITRHGEKFQNNNCLSLQGLERAAALASYFSKTPVYNNPPISYIFAAYQEGPNPHSGQYSYIRAKQTCTPIANHLKLSINSDFTPDQVKETAHEILTNPKYNKATVLICWEHHQIGPLVKALGGDPLLDWPHDVFDQVYMLTFKGSNKPVFQQFLQKLMFGDRASIQATPQPLPPIAVQCPNEQGKKVYKASVKREF